MTSRSREYYGRLAHRLCSYGIYLVKAAIKGKLRDSRFREHHRETIHFLLHRRERAGA